jgi:hypothetical protein
MRRAKILAGVVALSVLLGACAGRRPVKQGVSRVNKPAMRRGVVLDRDITGFLTAGYLLLDAEGRREDTFKNASGEANKRGRGIGAHLIVVYQNLDPADVKAVIVPEFMPEPPFSHERFRDELATLGAAPFTIFYWSRPDTPLPLGLFFHPDLPAETRTEVGDQPAVQVRVLVRSSPASMGYMIAGDVITHLDGVVVPGDGAALVKALIPKRGERVTFTVLRDGDPQDKVVVLYP